MTYTYHAKENEVREKATMEPPEIRDVSLKTKYDFDYNEHIKNLKRFPCTEACKELWKDGQEVAEGKDFELRNVVIRDYLDHLLNSMTLEQQEEVGFVLDQDVSKEANWRKDSYGINRDDVLKGLYIHDSVKYYFFNDSEEFIGVEDSGKFVPCSNIFAYPPTIPPSTDATEDAFAHWLNGELEYRKGLLLKAQELFQQKWYKAQIGMLETVIKQLPLIGQPYKEVTQDDIWKQADEAYNRHTPKNNKTQ